MAPTAFLTALHAIFLLLPPALCHMQLSWPYPLHSKYNPSTPEALIDYSMTEPLDASGSNFPCKNYHLNADRTPVVTYTAGSRYNITLEGSATHLGGSCQLSLSYDEGKTFKVIKSIIGGCPLTPSYDFTVPEFVPAGNALFAWTWQNHEGNREFYMNCAAIEVVNSASQKVKRASTSSLDDLPNLWVADLTGMNGCATVEGEDPVYPEPGPEVEYGGRMDGSSPATMGDCEVPTRNAGVAPSVAYGSSSVAATSTAVSYEDTTETTSATPSVTASATLARYTTATTSTSTSHTAGNAMNRFGAGQEASTTTITIDCPDTITMTLYPTATYSPPDVYTTSAPQSAYFYTCDYNDGSVPSKGKEDWVYDYPRQVAAGMECMPKVSEYDGGTEQYAQQGMVEEGWYRDDQYVRAGGGRRVRR
ncbi:hypothetical protein B0A48_02514 [Cryoendolithus antarcticus]|uniref:Chitin-binding type-4 domain-containing protein n=1 Tax=Cryoendolithus antarcticus TaxID=1507870 RepID=A0A1V8TNV1_9PEZI|nr:hypothetical protein B0A48_02514 [Cryoendolithus antarcticus]